MTAALLDRPAVAYRGWPALMVPTDPVPAPRAPGVESQWWERGACAGQPKPDLFMQDGETMAEAADRIRWFAVAYCWGCPVFASCEAQRDEYGTWAGALRHRGKRLPLIPLAMG